MPALICLAGLMLAFIWLSRFRLVISPEAVSYRNLWHGETAIVRGEITRAGFADRTGAFESPITFVIQTRSGSELRINAKVFSRDAVSELCSLESRAREC